VRNLFSLGIGLVHSSILHCSQTH